jgi:hypothetical protein
VAGQHMRGMRVELISFLKVSIRGTVEEIAF